MTHVSRFALLATALSAALLAPWILGAARRGGTRASAEATVARGRYLSVTMGCGTCHTPGAMFGSPDESRALSGSDLGWQGPWGVTFAPNLTPDKETGIGSWTTDQLLHALRTGQRPDGTQMRPPMPWPNLTQLTVSDARALAAFLRSLPPVSHRVPEALGPGETATSGATVIFPSPPAWDAQHMTGEE